MEEATLQSAMAALGIPKTHTTVGLANLVAAHKEYRSLFVNRRLPEDGWSDIQIQHFLFILSTLDTNNKRLTSSSRWCGVGEREGRLYSSLVANRHFGFAHGMGRSGDIMEPQPKAVGSSVLVQLTLFMAMDAIRRGSGLNVKYGILLPLCTGMSMSLVLSSLREANPDRSMVLWCRIDQKSCFKAISSAGLTCVVIPTTLEGDEVVTNLAALEEAMSDQVLAVITTTSCFAPRVRDKVDHVAKLCQTHNVHHIINNAYGLQCASTSKLINRACVVGRVDAIVCSTDKNFMVPVGTFSENVGGHGSVRFSSLLSVVLRGRRRHCAITSGKYYSKYW
jgi:O-phospho-L-seryl-tRNASec:L-selenocysteinyl-tRNA synthase